MTNASYPNTRMRRTRASSWSRAMYRETVLTPADLIWPLFVTDGKGVEEPVASLPGVSRWSVDGIAKHAKQAFDLGIPCVALFPNTQPNKRSDDGAGGVQSRQSDVPRHQGDPRCAARSDIGILTDVALDPYTSHGQDGLLDDSGYVLNDRYGRGAGQIRR